MADGDHITPQFRKAISQAWNLRSISAFTPKQAYKIAAQQVSKDLKKFGYITHGVADHNGINGLVSSLERERTSISPSVKAFIRGYADAELKEVQKKGDLAYLPSAVKLYAFLGEESRPSVERRVIQAITKSKEVDWPQKYNPKDRARLRGEAITHAQYRANTHNPESKLSHLLHRHVPTAMTTLIAGALLFLSFNITGYSVLGIATESSSFIGVGLVAVALVLGFLLLYKQKKILT